MIRKPIILLVIITSLSFFKLILVPEPVIKMMEFSMPFLMLGLIILNRVYDDSIRMSRKFDFELICVLAATILSMIAAYYFHNQAYAITFVTQRFIYFFLFSLFLVDSKNLY